MRYRKKINWESRYSLKQTPNLLAFIKRLFLFENINSGGRIEDNFKLVRQCTCGNKDCATVTLKDTKPWKKRVAAGSYCVNTDKGIVIIHFLKKGYVEIEALCYKNFPYKKEIDKFFKSNGEVKSTLNQRNITNYFKKLNREEMNVVYVDL